MKISVHTFSGRLLFVFVPTVITVFYLHSADLVPREILYSGILSFVMMASFFFFVAVLIGSVFFAKDAKAIGDFGISTIEMRRIFFQFFLNMAFLFVIIFFKISQTSLGADLFLIVFLAFLASESLFYFYRIFLYFVSNKMERKK